MELISLASIWQDAMLRAVLGLLVANLLARLAAGLATRTFRLRAWADWVASRILPWLLRAAIVEVALLSLPPEFAELRALAHGAVWLCVSSGLVRHLVEALREPA
jgi:hypothetical protein